MGKGLDGLKVGQKLTFNQINSIEEYKTLKRLFIKCDEHDKLIVVMGTNIPERNFIYKNLIEKIPFKNSR